MLRLPSHILEFDETQSHQRQRWFLRSMGGCAILLFLATCPLWLGTGEFPKVPAFYVFAATPQCIDWLLFGGMLLSLIYFLLRPFERPHPLPTAGFIACALLSIAINQHRFQPWLHQLMILAWFASVFRASEFLRYARLLIISIYFFSALSKFDHQFVHTLGQQFINTLAGFVHVDVTSWNWTLRLYVAAAFPLAELLIALGLLIRKSRQFAAWTAIILHLGLIAILGPWGLDHHLGVLCWNLFFVMQVAILFVAGKYAKIERRNDAVARPFTLKVVASRALILLPLLEPVGCFDHWPAWQLYAPRNSRVTMNVLEPAVSQLPESLQRHLRRTDKSPWVQVDLDRWSLEQCWVPIYPQDRFQLGVALAVAESSDLGGSVMLAVQEASARWTGARDQTVLRSTSEIAETAEAFWINALPTQPHDRAE